MIIRNGQALGSVVHGAVPKSKKVSPKKTALKPEPETQAAESVTTESKDSADKKST